MARTIIVAVVAIATFYFVYWVPFSLIPLGEYRWVAGPISAVIAIAVGNFVRSKLTEGARGALTSMFVGAVLVGAVGFVAGFFGPIIFQPQANQGPLLGIFITGPLGFVVGAVAGLIYHFLSYR